MAHGKRKPTLQPTALYDPIPVLPGKAWSVHSEYESRTLDPEVLRVGDYLRARGLLEGPSPNRAWIRLRHKARRRVARRGDSARRNGV